MTDFHPRPPVLASGHDGDGVAVLTLNRGLVVTHAELLNTDDSVVLSLKATNLLRLRRPRD
jgi:hypothetical protein